MEGGGGGVTNPVVIPKHMEEKMAVKLVLGRARNLFLSRRKQWVFYAKVSRNAS